MEGGNGSGSTYTPPPFVIATIHIHRNQKGSIAEDVAFLLFSERGGGRRGPGLLGGSGDLVSKVISPLIGVISNYKYSYLIYNPSY